MKLFNNKLFLILAIFSFLKPSGFDFYSFNTINAALNYARIFFALIIFAKYFQINPRFSKLLKSELAFFFCLFISTFINNSKLTDLAIFSISVIAFTMLIEICVRRKVGIFINALFINYFIIIVSNFILMYVTYGFKVNSVTTNDGRMSFLSSDNLTASYIFPALCTALLYANYKGQKYNILSIILYVFLILTVVMLWSATSLVGIIILLVYIFFIYENSLERFIKYKWLLSVSVALIIGFTFLDIPKYFSFIIVDLLKKDITMTGRTYGWMKGINGFIENPLFGAGYNATTIDNGVIQILYCGGIVSMIFLYIMYMTGTKRFFSIEKLGSLDKFFSVSLLIILIMSISESWFHFFGFYVILGLANKSQYLVPLRRSR